jgi:hypothetical protein
MNISPKTHKESIRHNSDNNSPFRIKPENIQKLSNIEAESEMIQGRHISLSNLLNELKQPKIIHK